ncbi:diacylglycerol/lipid kinase family protein [Dokdonella immobilis]|uniref:Diacylglycerol kinase family enzyme n=1 Tax=Dokdonella immobilis TaxID=578942 RepID=A0A1I5AFU0_9GAMM|nr:diacylglycerol kinase family protein [Dokdonella immobilis]SFN61265.1 Diacylglycerol kinase family enzyme [Dokdonella immobilis]
MGEPQEGLEFVIVLNDASGRDSDQDLPARIRAWLGERGHRVRVHGLDRDGDVVSACKAAAKDARQRSAILVACGGDGTINAVAREALDAGVPLGLLPRGTFNYFGRAHGIPSDLEPALEILVREPARPAQVGLVNGRPFLVNASIGLYPELLEDREGWKRRIGRHRAVAIISGLHTLLRDHRLWSIEIDDGSGRRRLRTPTLVVGNNPLQFARLGIDGAERIGRDALAAVTLRAIGKLGLLGLTLRGALGRLGEADDVSIRLVRSLSVSLGRPGRRVKVALDGEITRMRTPLEFSIAKRPLLVRAPHPATSGDDPG